MHQEAPGPRARRARPALCPRPRAAPPHPRPQLALCHIWPEHETSPASTLKCPARVSTFSCPPSQDRQPPDPRWGPFFSSRSRGLPPPCSRPNISSLCFLDASQLCLKKSPLDVALEGDRSAFHVSGTPGLTDVIVGEAHGHEVLCRPEVVHLVTPEMERGVTG